MNDKFGQLANDFSFPTDNNHKDYQAYKCQFMTGNDEEMSTLNG